MHPIVMMKRVFTFCLFALTCFQGFSQSKYFLIDSLDSNYKLSHHVLTTKDIYPIDHKIELFNITYNNSDGQNLILFSVLPDLETGQDWIETPFDQLQDSLIRFGHMQKLFEANTWSRFDKVYGEQTKYLNIYKPVVCKEGRYYVPTNCLLQFYAIRNRPKVFNNVFGTININLDEVTILEMEKIYNQTYPSTEFPLYTLRSPVYSTTMDRLRDRREYLSMKHTLADGRIAYQFWTYLDWNKHRFQFESERGIDRFVYLPEEGIVGGSFDFYFFHHLKKTGITDLYFLDNIRKEKIMISNRIIKEHQSKY